MRQFFPVEDLARDERFVQTNMAERISQTRELRCEPTFKTEIGQESRSAASNRLTPDRPGCVGRVRDRLMHGIMVGEIQALEGAGRTAHDFEAGDGSAATRFRSS